MHINSSAPTKLRVRQCIGKPNQLISQQNKGHCGIPEPCFLNSKNITWFQSLGKFRHNPNRSMVVEFIIALAKNSVLGRSRLLPTSALCHVGIVPDVPNPLKYNLEHPKAPLCGTCMIVAIQFASVPFPLTTDAANKLAICLNCVSSMPQVLSTAQKPVKLQNKSSVKTDASKNGPVSHRKQPNPSLVWQRVFFFFSTNATKLRN